MKTYKTTLNKEEFDKLPILQQRVAIARDVIARLSAKNLIPYSGQLFGETTKYLLDKAACKSAKDFLNKESCECCAKGAACLAYVGNFNRYNGIQMKNFSFKLYAYPQELLDIFGTELLDAIEIAFECPDFRNDNSQSYDWNRTPSNSRDIIIKGFKRFVHKTRLKKIYQNIIDNGGLFKVRNLTFGFIK